MGSGKQRKSEEVWKRKQTEEQQSSLKTFAKKAATRRKRRRRNLRLDFGLWGYPSLTSPLCTFSQLTPINRKCQEASARTPGETHVRSISELGL